MIDSKILLDFFNFDKPCPSVIKNCGMLRDAYKVQKDKITSKQCTTCTVAEFTHHFINNVLYKNYFTIDTIKHVNKTFSKPLTDNKNEDVYVPKKLYRRGYPINQTTYFGKNYLYVIDKINNYKVYAKILFSLTIFDIKIFILGRFQNSLKKFKILIINEKTYNVLYISKERKNDEV